MPHMPKTETAHLAPRTPAQWAKFIDRQACHEKTGKDFMNGWVADRKTLIKIIKEIQAQAYTAGHATCDCGMQESKTANEGIEPAEQSHYEVARPRTAKRYRSSLHIEVLDDNVDIEKLKDCMTVATNRAATILQKLLEEHKVSSRGATEKGRNIWVGTNSIEELS